MIVRNSLCVLRKQIVQELNIITTSVLWGPLSFPVSHVQPHWISHRQGMNEEWEHTGLQCTLQPLVLRGIPKLSPRHSHIHSHTPEQWPWTLAPIPQYIGQSPLRKTLSFLGYFFWPWIYWVLPSYRIQPFLFSPVGTSFFAFRLVLCVHKSL